MLPIPSLELPEPFHHPAEVPATKLGQFAWKLRSCNEAGIPSGHQMWLGICSWMLMGKLSNQMWIFPAMFE
jgi:hypothetical protein